MGGGDGIHRCPWCERTDIQRHYHDSEQEVPGFFNVNQFELLVLESAQVGLILFRFLATKSF